MSITIPRPQPGEYPESYAGYIAQAADVGDLATHLAKQGDETRKLFTALSEAQAGFRYAPGKWTPRDIVLHLADAERAFAYRLLTFARGADTPLPGFDEVGWVRVANASERGMPGLASELYAVRSATSALLQGLAEDALDRRGIANGNLISVRALAWVIAGHELHHLRIIRERYIVS